MSSGQLLDFGSFRRGSVRLPCPRVPKWPCYAEDAIFATYDCYVRLLEVKWHNPVLRVPLCHGPLLHVDVCKVLYVNTPFPSYFKTSVQQRTPDKRELEPQKRIMSLKTL